jgi:membrane protein DedA with SNARE-associated domain
MLLIGYFLGKSIPNIEQNIHIVVFIVIILSLIPMLIKYIKDKKENQKIKNIEKESFDSANSKIP